MYEIFSREEFNSHALKQVVCADITEAIVQANNAVLQLQKDQAKVVELLQTSRAAKEALRIAIDEFHVSAE